MFGRWQLPISAVSPKPAEEILRWIVTIYLLCSAARIPKARREVDSGTVWRQTTGSQRLANFERRKG
jgi:hypothetical protein